VAAVKENYIDVKQLAIETLGISACFDVRIMGPSSQRATRKNWHWKSDRAAAKIFPHCRRISGKFGSNIKRRPLPPLQKPLTAKRFLLPFVPTEIVKSPVQK